MRRVLFVTNGHGEAAIAERIAREVAAVAPTPFGLDHLALVGQARLGTLAPVGPRRSLPSGGLVAMGNVVAFARDVAAGFPAVLASQMRFLGREGSRYDCAVAVGDVYALTLTRLTRRPTVFVGTAKSVYVAAYGRFERTILRRAARVFVRDAATAAHLRRHGVAADSPGNVMVELGDDAPPPPAEFADAAAIGVLPGSRTAAYDDAVRLAAVVRALGERTPNVRALLSIAPALDRSRFLQVLSDDGWRREDGEDDAVAFRLRAGRARLIGWAGEIGTLLRAVRIVLGLAGTANEQAAGVGIPVVALESGDGWYRMRQRRLLDDALMLAPPQPGRAAEAVAALLGDPPRLEQMRAKGRERMGGPGASRVIAQAIVDVAFDEAVRR